MKTSMHQRLIALVCVVALAPIFPTSLFASGQSDVSFDIPFDEIYGLLEALQEAGNNVAGQAGIEVRASIDKLSSEIGERIDQLMEKGEDFWKMMYGDISKEIRNLQKFLKDYTAQVNVMVRDRITQIDTALANRLDQISDMITDTVWEVDGLIQRTVTAVVDGGVILLETGEKSIITIVNNAVANMVRMVLIILLVILLVVVLVLAWKNILPKTVPAIVITSVLGAVILAGSLVFIFSNTVMAYVFGTKIELATPEAAQRESEDAYEGFVADAKGGASVSDLKVKGSAVMDKLLIAKYVIKDPDEVKKIEARIASVQTFLYPPPEPGSTIKLGTTSKYYKERVLVVQKNAILLKVKPTQLYLTPDRLRIDPGALRLKIDR